MAEGTPIAMVSSEKANAEYGLPDGMTLDEYEQAIIRDALKRSSGNKSQAARMLGLTRNALRYRLAQMGLETDGGQNQE